MRWRWARPDSQGSTLEDRDEGAAARSLLQWLATREHSRSELHRKLRAKGFAEPVVEACLDRLASRGLQSDQRFVEGYVEGRRRRGYGPHRIRRELAERGVDEDLVGASLDPDADHWYALMVQVHDKRFGSGPPQDSQECVRRARFLQYRGFDVALVRRFLWSQD